MIICAGNNETFPFATPTGVGLIETAMNVTQLCLFDPPSYLLFVGTAGSYGNAALLDLVESKTAANIELSFLQKKSYTPLDNVITSRSDNQREPIVNSSNYITTDETLAKAYLSLGIEIENMEFFSVVRVAQTFDIPVGGLFCVTNFCNATAHQDFLRHHDEAKSKLSEFITHQTQKSFT